MSWSEYSASVPCVSSVSFANRRILSFGIFSFFAIALLKSSTVALLSMEMSNCPEVVGHTFNVTVEEVDATAADDVDATAADADVDGVGAEVEAEKEAVEEDAEEEEVEAEEEEEEAAEEEVGGPADVVCDCGTTSVDARFEEENEKEEEEADEEEEEEEEDEELLLLLLFEADACI